jgi:hypothetical protein
MAVTTKIAGWLRRLAEWLSPSSEGIGERVVRLLNDPIVGAIKQAILKQEIDPGVVGGSSNFKRDEALEWAERYAAQRGTPAPRDSWKTRLLLELLVAESKGKL